MNQKIKKNQKIEKIHLQMRVTYRLIQMKMRRMRKKKMKKRKRKMKRLMIMKTKRYHSQ
jgi:hypothetical protein